MMTKKRLLNKSILVISLLIILLFLINILALTSAQAAANLDPNYGKTAPASDWVQDKNGDWVKTDATTSTTPPSTTPATSPNTNTKKDSSGGGIIGTELGIFAADATDNWLVAKAKIWAITWQKGDVTAVNGYYLKWMLLALVIILIYSSLSYANFPENNLFKIIASVVIGFLATFLITTQELLVMLNSYTALGVTIAIFLPIMILGFFTIIIASKANPFGIYLQKILWLIYSVYLFIKTAGLLIISREIKAAATGTSAWGKILGESAAGIKANWVTKLIDWLISWVRPIIEPMLPPVDQAKILLEVYSTQMLAILSIVAIAVFVIMVLGDDYVMAWLMKSREDAAINAYKSGLRMEKGRLEGISEQMMRGK